MQERKEKKLDLSKKRLGRGLAALIGDADLAKDIEDIEEKIIQNKSDLSLSIKKLVPSNYNPRKSFHQEEIESLAQSIKEHGILQPLLVRPLKQDGKEEFFEIIAGERRYRAALHAGLKEVPAILCSVDERKALEIALIENVQRTDLNAIEEALGYAQLIEEHHYSQEELARAIGKSRSHIANILRLLKLPEKVQEMLKLKQITIGHARCLINIENAEKLAQEIVAKGLSVRQTEQLVRQYEGKEASSRSQKGTTQGALAEKEQDFNYEDAKNQQILRLEEILTKATGISVTINQKDEGGILQLHYNSIGELEKICSLLQATYLENY